MRYLQSTLFQKIYCSAPILDLKIAANYQLFRQRGQQRNMKSENYFTLLIKGKLKRESKHIMLIYYRPPHDKYRDLFPYSWNGSEMQ